MKRPSIPKFQLCPYCGKLSPFRHIERVKQVYYITFWCYACKREFGYFFDNSNPNKRNRK